MKKILVVNADRDWIDRNSVIVDDIITAVDEQGREHEVKFDIDKGWLIIRDSKVVFAPGNIWFSTFFDHKPKEFKIYVHRP